MRRYRWILIVLALVAAAIGTAVGTRMYGQHRLAQARSAFEAVYGEPAQVRQAYDTVDLQGQMMNARAAEAQARAGDAATADGAIEELLVEAAGLRAREQSMSFLIALEIERIALEIAEDRGRPVEIGAGASRTDGWRWVVVRDFAGGIEKQADTLRDLSPRVPIWERAWRWASIDLEQARALEYALELGEALADGTTGKDVLIRNMLDGTRRARDVDALRERLSSTASSDSPARG